MIGVSSKWLQLWKCNFCTSPFAQTKGLSATIDYWLGTIAAITWYICCVGCSFVISHATAVHLTNGHEWSNSEHILVSAWCGISHYLCLLITLIKIDRNSIFSPGYIGSRSTSGGAGEGPGLSIICETSNIGKCLHVKSMHKHAYTVLCVSQVPHTRA